MRSISDMPNRKKVKWFDNEMYQVGSDIEFLAVHIYDKENQVIAVFRTDIGKVIYGDKFL